jgi:hypothetical protein
MEDRDRFQRSQRLVSSCHLRGSSNGWRGSFESLTYLIVHSGFDGAYSDLDCILDCARRRVSVTDDADATNSEEWCPAVITRVESLERAPHVLLIDSGMLTQESKNHWRNGLIEFEDDVSHEAVADDDIKCPAIAGARGQISTLEVAVEIEAGFLKKSIRFLHDSVPLLWLFADR